MTQIPSPELSIIIVNWNSSGYVSKCIQTIYEQTHGITYEVIVVDNASFDGCGERLALEYPKVIFIQSQSNLGFARANNLGAEHALGDILLFLNPDTEVRDCAVEHLYTQIQTLPNCGVVGCRLLNKDGFLQTSCVQAFPTILNQFLDSEALRRWFPQSRLWGNAMIFERPGIPAEVDTVSGACLMIKRAVFERVGMFSTEYFMYSEDIDLCFKVREAGWKSFYVPTAVVTHYGGASSSQKSVNTFSSVMMLEARLRFFRKTRSPWYCSLYRFAIFSASIIRIFLLLLIWLVRRMRRNGSALDIVMKKWVARMFWTLGGEKWVKKDGAG